MAYTKAGFWGGALLDRSGNALLSVPFQILNPDTDVVLPLYDDINRTNPHTVATTDGDGNAKVFADVGLVNIFTPSTGLKKLIHIAMVDITQELEDASFQYVHDQGIPSNTWVVNHNLGGKPNVTVVDSADSVVEGSIQYNSANTLTLTFNGAFGGKAYLS